MDGTVDVAINLNPHIQVTQALQLLTRLKEHLQLLRPFSYTAIEISIAETLPA